MTEHDAPGASEAEQTASVRPASASFTTTPVSVRLPVLLTRIPYATVSPVTNTPPSPLPRLVTVLSMPVNGFCVIGIHRSSLASGASLEPAVTTLNRPLSQVPADWLPSLPASSSAWVKLWVALQVVLPPTGMLLVSQLMLSLSLSSLRLRPVMVTLPALLTR